MALDVQVGFLLSRETGLRKIFRCGAAAHGDIHRMKLTPAKRVIGGDDLPFQLLRQLGSEDGLAYLTAALMQGFQVARIEVGEQPPDLQVQFGFAQEISIRLRRDGEPIGHLHAFGGQFLEHLAKRSILAADERNIVHGDVIKPADIISLGCRRGGALCAFGEIQRRAARASFPFQGDRCRHNNFFVGFDSFDFRKCF